MPLRNNILFVDNALKAYEYVNVDSEITRIFFAIAQASLLNDINKEIHNYLDALERGECREVLGIDFKKLTHKSYWKKGNRLPSDMMALKRKPLSAYGINCEIDGHCLEHTGHIYEMIEACIAELTTLLKDVRRKTLNAPAGMFSAFFHNEASEKGNEWAETEYDEWKMNLGKLTFDRLKEKQTLVVAEFLKKGVLRYAAPPTVRELNEVRLDKVREYLPSDYEIPDDFEKQCAMFRRFISWQGDILIIDYDCYGKYFFQFFNRLTVEDQQAMFALDHTLRLIHEDMERLKAADEAVPPAVSLQEERVASAAEKCFKFANDFTKQQVTEVVKTFYKGEHADLALIEVTLYDHGQLKKRNSHTAFINTLVEWGLIKADENGLKQLISGIKDKYKRLPIDGYKEWNNILVNEKNRCFDIGKKLGNTMKYQR